MKELEKINSIIRTARRCSDSTPIQNERSLCRALELVGGSLLDTAEHFRECWRFEELGKYLEGSLIGKISGFNQLSILLSFFFPGASPDTIDAGALKEELMTEEGAENA